MNKTLLAAALVVVALGATPALAVPTITLHSSNVGISALNVAIDDMAMTISIEETWTSTGPGALLFSGFDLDLWSVTKTIHNNTGIDWDRLANELLDVAGDGDDGLDPLPYPGHVPAGFTTSNHSDGLTFVSPRSSDVWSSILIDEVTNVNGYRNPRKSGGAFLPGPKNATSR